MKQRGNDGRRYWRECHNKGGYWRDLLVAVLHRPVRSGQASLVGGRTLVTGRDIVQAVENAWRLGVNPGGEVLGGPGSADDVPGVIRHYGRLVTDEDEL